MKFKIPITIFGNRAQFPLESNLNRKFENEMELKGKIHPPREKHNIGTHLRNSYTHPLNNDITIYYLYIDMSDVINSDILFIHF